MSIPFHKLKNNKLSNFQGSRNTCQDKFPTTNLALARMSFGIGQKYQSLSFMYTKKLHRDGQKMAKFIDLPAQKHGKAIGANDWYFTFFNKNLLFISL